MLKVIYEAMSDVTKAGSKENQLVRSLLSKHHAFVLDSTFQMKIDKVGKTSGNCLAWQGKYVSGYIVMSDAIPAGLMLTKQKVNPYAPAETEGVYVPLVGASVSAVLNKIFPILDGKLTFSRDTVHTLLMELTEAEWVKRGQELVNEYYNQKGLTTPINEGFIGDKGWTTETWDESNKKELVSQMWKYRRALNWTASKGADSWENVQGNRAFKGKTEDDYKNMVIDHDDIMKFLDELKGLSKPRTTSAAVKPTTQMSAFDPEAEEKIAWEKQYANFERGIQRVCNGDIRSLISIGAPGLGKTFRMNKVLKANGYKEGDNLYTLTGSAKPIELYKVLWSYSNPGDIVVLDDCNPLIESGSDGAELIKGAVDTSKNMIKYSRSTDIKAMISVATGKPLSEEEEAAGVEAEEVLVPKSFVFKGSMIILTNMDPKKIDQPIMSRCVSKPFKLTREDRIEIIQDIIQHGVIGCTPNTMGKKLPSEWTQRVFDDFLAYLDAHPKVSIDQLTPRTICVLASTNYDCFPDNLDIWEDEKTVEIQNAINSMQNAKKINY